MNGNSTLPHSVILRIALEAKPPKSLMGTVSHFLVLCLALYCRALHSENTQTKKQWNHSTPVGMERGAPAPLGPLVLPCINITRYNHLLNM